jgi:hypothetical protein
MCIRILWLSFYFDFYKIEVLCQKWEESGCCFLTKSCFCDVQNGKKVDAVFLPVEVAFVTWMLFCFCVVDSFLFCDMDSFNDVDVVRVSIPTLTNGVAFQRAN